jgi:hypothetical protein
VPSRGSNDLLDRLALDEVLAPNTRNRFHNQHPYARFELKWEAYDSHTSGGQFWTPIPNDIQIALCLNWSIIRCS